MIIRTATIDDLPQIAAVESECFPPAEAATKEEFADRLIHYANHFWLMFDEQNDNKLVAFVDGFVTNGPDLTDEMYEKASMHDESGAWQMIFGVNTIPSYRRRGLFTVARRIKWGVAGEICILRAGGFSACS